MASYPPSDSKINVDVVEWHDRYLIAVDVYGLPYIHWFEDDARWFNVWEDKIRTSGLSLSIRVGRKDGPRGRKCFVLGIASEIVVVKPKQPEIPFDATNDVPRSPLDLVSSGSGVVTSTRNKQRKGDCSFTVSLPSEEDRILVNRLCEKAKEAGLVKHKGHYPGQHFKAWLLEQAMADGLLQL